MLEILSDTGFRQNEKNFDLCQLLVSKNIIELRNNSKKTYILSDKGKIMLQNLNSPSILGSNELQSHDYSTYLNSIRKEFTSLKTSFRPFVKIKEIRKRLVSNQQVPVNIFDDALVWLHNKGEITLEAGFIKNKNEQGIEAKNGQIFEYIIDVI